MSYPDPLYVIHTDNPYEAPAQEMACEVLVVGGSSAGSAAALEAGRLGLDTVLVMRSPRELGGLTTNGINPDTDIDVRYIGGLAFELDVVARRSTGYNAGKRSVGKGYFAPPYVFFEYFREECAKCESLTIVANYFVKSVEKDEETRRITSVTFENRLERGKYLVVRPKVVIDGEVEGDLTALAGVETTLIREGKEPSDDPTRDREAYAGVFYAPRTQGGQSILAGGHPLPGSTFERGTEAETMAWNSQVVVMDYGEGDENSPWVLKNPPPGYDPTIYSWMKRYERGVHLGGGHHRWRAEQYLSWVEGWRMPNGKHVLTSSDFDDHEENERAHITRTIGGLYYAQHVLGKFSVGLAPYNFQEGPPPKYTLEDFGTTTHCGNAPLPSVIYMREGRRMVNDHVFGGRLMETHGSPHTRNKTYWHGRGVFFNAMIIDIHGVTDRFVEGSGPEGMQIPRLAGIHDFGLPAIHFDVFVPRETEAANLLVAAAGAFTHEAMSAFPRMETARLIEGQICARGAAQAVRNGVAVQDVDVELIQLQGLERGAQALVYFDDNQPGTRRNIIDHMLGVRGVPEHNLNGIYQSERGVTTEEFSDYVTKLWGTHTSRPVSDAVLQTALRGVETHDGLVTRGSAFRSISQLAGVRPARGVRGQLFADVPASHPLAQLLLAWEERGWIRCHGAYKFQPDSPIGFSELKRHLFNVLWGEFTRGGTWAFTYEPVLCSDTFNRADSPLGSPEMGAAYVGAEAWVVDRGTARAGERDTPATVWVPVDAESSIIELDLFLEQTLDETVAGIAFDVEDAENMGLFLLSANGDRVESRLGWLRYGRLEIMDVAPLDGVPFAKLGFTLDVTLESEGLTCRVDGQRVHGAPRSGIPLSPGAGFVYRSGEPSLIDNFSVRSLPS